MKKLSKSELVEQRVWEAVELILDANYSVRELAKILKVSKSTVHLDLTTRLKEIDYEIYEVVQDIMNEHKETEYRESKKK